MFYGGKKLALNKRKPSKRREIKKYGNKYCRVEDKKLINTKAGSKWIIAKHDNYN